MAFSGYSRRQPLILVLLLLMIPSTYQLSFNRDIEYGGDACPINGTIKLTTDQKDSFVSSSSGRATYSKPVQVGNKSTGTFIDCTGKFSFVITDRSRSFLIFFLVPKRFLPPNSAGPCLGLFNCDKLNSSDSPYVTVWYDNNWHNYDHFGIGINSIRSVTTGPWFPKSRQKNVWIRYDSDLKTLTAFVTYDDIRNSVQDVFYVPDLRESLPKGFIVGFSASTGGSFQKHTIVSWDFNSTLATVDTRERKSIRTISIAVGVLIGVLVLVSLLIWFFLCKKRRISGGEDQGGEVLLTNNVRNRRGQPINQENDAMPINEIANTREEQTHGVVNDDGVSREDMLGNSKYGPKRFSLRELVEATSNFGERAIIGEGAFGRVYKGFLIEYKDVAIKRFKENSRQGIKEFKAEVDVICQLKHRNLVELFGYYHDGGLRDLILVYEFMPNGTLYDNLFNDKRNLLTWEKRYNIALDVARGLYYLHEGCKKYVVHRDIKSANILLDSEFRAKLGDFGLARVAERGNELLSTYVSGTKGYLAPECALYGQKSTNKSDVYSFGIVLLEIVSGKRALEYNGGVIQELVAWVWGLYGKRKILRGVERGLSKELHKQQMERLLVVGLWCAHPHPLSRPTIQTAFQVLSSKEDKLPDLPSKMPERTNPVVFESSSSSSVEHFAKFLKKEWKKYGARFNRRRGG